MGFAILACRFASHVRQRIIEWLGNKSTTPLAPYHLCLLPSLGVAHFKLEAANPNNIKNNFGPIVPIINQPLDGDTSMYPTFQGRIDQILIAAECDENSYFKSATIQVMAGKNVDFEGSCHGSKLYRLRFCRLKSGQYTSMSQTSAQVTGPKVTASTTWSI